MMFFGVPFGTLLALAAIAVVFLSTPVDAWFGNPKTNCRAVVCARVTTNLPNGVLTAESWRQFWLFGGNVDEYNQMSINPGYTTKDQEVWQGLFPRAKNFICNYDAAAACRDLTDDGNSITYYDPVAKADVTRDDFAVYAKECILRDHNKNNNAIVAC